MKPWKVCVFKETSERGIQWFSVSDYKFVKLAPVFICIYLFLLFYFIFHLLIYLSVLFILCIFFFSIMRWKMEIRMLQIF